MEVTVHIPDDLVSRMNRAGADLSRRALEGLALEEYRNGHYRNPTCYVFLVSRRAMNLTAFSRLMTCMRMSPWLISTAISATSKAWDFNGWRGWSSPTPVRSITSF